ncbi:MAG: M23 family metallopeptidase [Candidatus Paceibacterota bacterium]
MSLRLFLCIVTLLLSVNGFVYAGSFKQISDSAGPFVTPISETQTNSLCGKPRSEIDQYHMQYNADFSKYHIGEDINGLCGGSTDKDYPLLAIADGKVVYLDKTDNDAKGKQLYVRYSFPYAFGINGVQTFDSVYLHINDVNSSKVQWSGSGTGSEVFKGDVIAYLGGTGGWTPHLHWEAQWDDSLSINENSYQKPLSIKHALKYRVPSMIVDDRRDLKGYRVPDSDSWYSFTMQGNAPSSTAYIMHNGQRKSLKKAIAAGWIPSQGVLHEKDGTWYYYGDVDANFFYDGERYAIKTLVSGPTHYISVPRNNFQEDRARLDMLHAVENDSRFVNVQVETFDSQIPWDSNSAWNLHWMRFELSDGRTVYANQVTNRLYPLLRCTAYYDPDTSKWTNWDCIDKNRLY